MRALALGPRHLFGLVAATFALHGPVLQTVHGQVPIFAEGQGERQLAGYQWDTLWTFGGPGDTLLASAHSLVPDGSGGLFFADARSFKVHHLDSDGQLLWSWGREGGGPGEVRVAMAMTLDRDGGVLLVDPGNLRIVRIDRDGRLVAEVPLRIRDPASAGHSPVRLFVVGKGRHPGGPFHGTDTREIPADRSIRHALGLLSGLAHIANGRQGGVRRAAGTGVRGYVR